MCDLHCILTITAIFAILTSCDRIPPCSLSRALTQTPKHPNPGQAKQKVNNNFRLPVWLIGCVDLQHTSTRSSSNPLPICYVRRPSPVDVTLSQYFYCSFSDRLTDTCSYKNAMDGLMRVHREEGFRRLFSGASTATARGFLMTIGQIAFYDQAKSILLSTGYFQDDPRLHFVASLAAGATATLLTQPIDVIKTRSMSAKPGEFKSVLAVVTHTAKLGPMGFFKGFVPAFVRLGPHTILTFIMLEQLRLNLGYLPAAIPNAVSNKL